MCPAKHFFGCKIKMATNILAIGVRKLVIYHYRRAGFDRDLREFKVILEKDGKRIKVGELLNCEGTYHTPKQIFQLVEKGWRIVAVMSCFRWNWSSRRYISPYDEKSYSGVDYDIYGHSYIDVLYSGYYEIIDVFDVEGNRRRYQAKYWFCHDTDKETTKFDNIPKETEKMFDETEWLQ